MVQTAEAYRPIIKHHPTLQDGCDANIIAAGLKGFYNCPWATATCLLQTVRKAERKEALKCFIPDIFHINGVAAAVNPCVLIKKVKCAEFDLSFFTFQHLFTD